MIPEGEPKGPKFGTGYVTGACGCDCECGPDDPHTVDAGCTCTLLGCPCADTLEMAGERAIQELRHFHVHREAISQSIGEMFR